MPSEYEYKLFKAGSGTSVAVVLPPGWLRYCGLRAGDMVKVTADGNLTIEPKRKEKKP